MMDLYHFACPVNETDSPDEVTLVSSQCGYSHNKMDVKKLDVQGVVTPPGDLGVCVRPLRRAADDIELAVWFEYLRRLGADRVHIYVADPRQLDATVLTFYRNETLGMLSIKDWSVVERHVEKSVSDEAAINDCISSNIMSYR